MLRTLCVTSAVFSASFLVGCASIVGGVNQPLSVKTTNDGAIFSGASCSLTNDKGAWYVVTPGSVTILRSFADLSVNCSFAGVPNGSVVAKSGVKALLLGNILIGGGIGAIVDTASGAAFDYPEIIAVEMGKALTQESRSSTQPISASTSGSWATSVNPVPAPVVKQP